MSTPPPRRRAARWAAVVITPLLLAPFGNAASGNAAAAVTAAASAAPVRNANGWVRFTDPAATYVDQDVQPGLAQMAGGSLVVAWRQTDLGSSAASLATTTVAPDNSVASPTAQLTWPTLNGDPEVLPRPGGAEIVFVGNDGNGGYFGDTNAFRLLVDSAGVVSGPAEERYFALGAGVPSLWTQPARPTEPRS